MSIEFQLLISPKLYDFIWQSLKYTETILCQVQEQKPVTIKICKFGFLGHRYIRNVCILSVIYTSHIHKTICTSITPFFY